MIDYNAYTHALHLGLSEREATEIGENAAYESIIQQRQMQRHEPSIKCHFCNNAAVTGTNGYGVCSEECHKLALDESM